LALVPGRNTAAKCTLGEARQANLLQAVLFHDREWIDIFLY
jgi:hypothetical protein